jgi:lipopolysaccharide biosynthesis protein
MDIGPFLKQIKLIKESGKSYNYILKLHSKSDNIWRNELMDPLLSNPETIKNYLHSFTNNSDVGMVCSKGWLLNMDNLNNSILSELLKKYNLYINKTCKFVGGTIFWIKWDILKSFFTVNVIDDIYSHLEKGYMSNNTPTYVHSMERLLGILIINYKTKYLDL